MREVDENASIIHKDIKQQIEAEEVEGPVIDAGIYIEAQNFYESDLIRSHCSAQIAKTMVQSSSNSTFTLQDPKFKAELQAYFDKQGYKINIEQLSDEYKDPYSDSEKLVYHEMERTDAYFAKLLKDDTSFVLGKEPRFILDVNWTYKSKEEEKEALSQIMNDNELQYYLDQLIIVSRGLNFFQNLADLREQSKIYGRAAILMEFKKQQVLIKKSSGGSEYKNIDTIPKALKPIPSLSLGQVLVDKDYWIPRVIQNKSMAFPECFIPTEKLIYMVNDDRNSSPKHYRYGQSVAEKVRIYSVLNKMINEKSLFNINFRAAQPTRILSYQGVKSEEYLQKITKKMRDGAGNSLAVAQPTTVTELPATPTQDLRDQRFSNNKEMVNGMNQLELLVDSAILNRATADKVTQIHYETYVHKEQDEIQSVIIPQYVNRFLTNLIYRYHKKEIEKKRRLLERGEDLEYVNKLIYDQTTGRLIEQTPPTAEEEIIETEEEPLINPITLQEEEPILPGSELGLGAGAEEQIKPNTRGLEEAIPTFNKLDINEIKKIYLDENGEIDFNRMGWKIKIGFEPLNFDTALERMGWAEKGIDIGVLSTEGAQRRLDLDDEIEKAKLEQEQKQQEEALLFRENQAFNDSLLTREADNLTTTTKKQEEEEEEKQTNGNPSLSNTEQKPTTA